MTLTNTSSRRAEFEISNFILNRWSPRSILAEELSETDLMSLFEAARWAPSSGNAQPWRFIFARRNSPYWSTLFELLNEGNKIWAKDAGALIVVISRRVSESGAPSRTYQFDAGAAWENLALEASVRGLVAHGMAGFDYERARKELGIPDVFDVMAMIAVGKKGPPGKLPPKLQEREFPNMRKPLSEIIMEGRFTPNST